MYQEQRQATRPQGTHTIFYFKLKEKENKDNRCQYYSPIKTTCFYSRMHVCNTNKYGCLFIGDVL
jgi:hypothetical protein